MTHLPAGAADRYFVYRPLLDLIGRTEGTDRGDGYDETLGYGALTDGDVSLVTMSLDQIEALQGKMLALCAPFLAAGCSQTVPASDCDGWSKLSPAGPTRAYVIEQDRPFAEQVAAHNLHGQSRGCW